MNDRAYRLTNTTHRDFKMWCRANKLKQCDKKSKELFFKQFIDGKPIKDKNGRYLRINQRNKDI